MTSQANQRACDHGDWGSIWKPGRGTGGSHSPPGHFGVHTSGLGNQAPSASRRRPGLPAARPAKTARDPRTPLTQTPGALVPLTRSLKQTEWPLRQSESFFQPGPASFLRLPASLCLQGNPHTEGPRESGPKPSGCCSLQGAENRETHLFIKKKEIVTKRPTSSADSVHRKRL